MENSYLVIFSSHVDSEVKKNKTIETLKHLSESNIDVCLSTHSSLYLDELSQYVKYVIYDNNNEFLTLQDYIDNSKYIDNVSKYGHPNGKTFHEFGEVSMSIPGSPHSKCALSLLRNGVFLSHFNNYKWTIYLEYDIVIPKLGFKHFFEFHINHLNSLGKKCFYYETKFDNFHFLWGGPFIFHTESIFNNQKFMKNDWYSTNKNWVKEWYVGFFESILEHVMHTSFNKDEIITEIIQNKYKNFWGIDDLSQIGNFNYEQSFYEQDKYLRKVFQIHLYPNIDTQGNIKLYLYCNNRGDMNVNLSKILVYSNKILHINKKNEFVKPYNWFFIPIDVKDLASNDVIVLSWAASIDNKLFTHTEYVEVDNLKHIHNNIMSIKFK